MLTIHQRLITAPLTQGSVPVHVNQSNLPTLIVSEMDLRVWNPAEYDYGIFCFLYVFLCFMTAILRNELVS